jgi:hypothetical protein
VEVESSVCRCRRQLCAVKGAGRDLSNQLQSFSTAFIFLKSYLCVRVRFHVPLAKTRSLNVVCVCVCVCVCVLSKED